MKKKPPHNPQNIIKPASHGLGRGSKTTRQSRTHEVLDDVDVDDDFPESEYRRDPYRSIGHHGTQAPLQLHPASIRELVNAISATLQLHPETIQRLATAIAESFQFHPNTIREIAKAIVVNLELVPGTITKLAEEIYGHLTNDMAALVEENTKQADGRIACSECSVGDRRSVHPFHDMTTEDVRIFMGWKSKAAIYARTQDGKMPPPVSAITPHSYDPHVIALLRDQSIVFPQPRYDRNVHLALLPKVEAERAKKKNEFRRKQSAHMVRENARRRAERVPERPPQKRKPTTKSTHTRTSRTKKH